MLSSPLRAVVQARSYTRGMDITRRLLIVEDEPLTATLLSDVLGALDFEIVTAHSAAEARRAIRTFDPDAALVDIVLGHGPSGIDLAHVIREKHPHIGVLLLTKYPDLESAGFHREGIPPGCGFLRKDLVSDADAIVAAIDAVLAEQASRVRHDQDADRPLAALTKAQVEVLRLMAAGYGNEAIAVRRDCSVSAVQNLIVGIYRRLDIEQGGEVNPRVEAIRRFVAVAGLPDRS
jgi:DNA-binding NarL/FixJ family response regulator